MTVIDEGRHSPGCYEFQDGIDYARPKGAENTSESLTIINDQESIMAEHDIQTSQKLLKDLEKEMLSMTQLMSQMRVMSHNLDQTWTALYVTQRNWKRRVEEDFELD